MASRLVIALLVVAGLLLLAVAFIWYFDRPLDFVVNKSYQIY
jgi:hypothetical protein